MHGEPTSSRSALLKEKRLLSNNRELISDNVNQPVQPHPILFVKKKNKHSDEVNAHKAKSIFSRQK